MNRNRELFHQASRLTRAINALALDGMPKTWLGARTWRYGFERLVALRRHIATLPATEPQQALALYEGAYSAALLLRKKDNGHSPSLCENLAAKAILDDEIYAISRNSPLTELMGGIMSFTKILAFVFGLVSIPPLLFDAKSLAWYEAALISHNWLILGGVSGAFGSMTGLLIRLREFDQITRSRLLLRLTGSCLPLVGATFGVVTCSLYASGIVNIGIVPPATAGPSIGQQILPNVYLCVVLGFVSGFSERFTPNLLKAIANRVPLSGSGPTDAGSGNHRRL